MGQGGPDQAGVDAPLRRVLARQVGARLVALPISVVVVALVHESAVALRYAAVALLLWLPWSLLWQRLVRTDAHRVWWLSVGDVVLCHVGLLQFGPEGWIVAQLGSLLAVTTVGLTAGRRDAQVVLGVGLAVGGATAWFVDLPVLVVVTTLLALLGCAAQLISSTTTASSELAAVADAAALDPATGLPTRGSLVRFVEDGLAAGDQVSVAIFRLQALEEIAGAFGRDHADETLRALEVDLTGHRDTFIAVVDSSTIALSARRESDDTGLADRVTHHLGQMALLPSLADLVAHVGWALGPTDTEDAADLVRIAERAARMAAEHGHPVHRTNPDDAVAIARRLELLGSLRTVTRSPDFAVHFQPQIDVATRRVVGVEALARWTHHRLGPVRPDEFIHLAEIGGLLPEITMEVLDRSIGQLAAWTDDGLDLTMSVNVSVVDLQRRVFREQLLEIWQRHQIGPDRLILEITETQTSMTSEIDATLRSLADAGVRFAIDDFGTGHSSLLRVRDLPVTELKVDRAFVGSMMASSDDEVIVASTMQLGRTLGLEVVAEGVEDEATLERLEAMGCDRAQGYLISPAVPAEGIAEIHRRWPGRQPAPADGDRPLGDLRRPGR